MRSKPAENIFQRCTRLRPAVWFGAGLMLAGLAATGCHVKSRPDSEDENSAGNRRRGFTQLLKVGVAVFTLADFEKYQQHFEAILKVPDEPGDAEKTAVLNQFIQSRLLLVAAKEEGFQVTSEDRQALIGELGGEREPLKTLPEEDVLAYKYLRQALAGGITINDAELEDYFNRQGAAFKTDDVYHVKEILVEKETLANQIHQELLLGGKSRFGAFARQFSIAPSAASGGEMGLFKKGELPQEFENVIFSLQPGTISNVIRTQYGYHIFYLEELIRAHTQRFYEVRDEIRQIVRQEKERVLINNLYETLRSRYQPVLFVNALNFKADRDIITKIVRLEENNAQ